MFGCFFVVLFLLELLCLFDVFCLGAGECCFVCCCCCFFVFDFVRVIAVVFLGLCWMCVLCFLLFDLGV